MVGFTEYVDAWQPLNVSSVLMDSSISSFEVVHVSRDISNYFSTARDYCLSGKKFTAVQEILTCEPENQEQFSHFWHRYTDFVCKNYPSVS